jgi:hypothetical protein
MPMKIYQTPKQKEQRAIGNNLRFQWVYEKNKRE